jgi:hypothetical protein
MRGRYRYNCNDRFFLSRFLMSNAPVQHEEGAVIAGKNFALGFATLLLTVLVGAAAAAAKDKPMTDRGAAQSNVPPAPVGHRQPTAADAAKVQPSPVDPEREKRERALDKKLQICRGC